MAGDLPPQRLMLRAERLVTVQPTPDGDLLDRALEAAASRLPLHHPVALLRPAPVMRESQEVKGPWRRPALAASRRRPASGPRKRHQPRFVRMDRQTVFAKPLRQYG